MPAHILIRVSTGVGGKEGDLYVDAYGRQIMDFQGLLTFTRSLGIPQFHEEYVLQRPPTAVYARVLRNLIGIQGKLFDNAQKRGSKDLDVAILGMIGLCSQSISIADPAS